MTTSRWRNYRIAPGTNAWNEALRIPGIILKDHGTHRAPVNLIDLTAWLGVQVEHDVHASADWSGALVAVDRKDASSPPRIFVRGGEAPTRQRFTIAHEIGHLMLHDLGVQFRDTKTYRGANAAADRLEQQANRFASELLMPSEFVYQELRRIGDKVDELARIFEVSPKAMRFRLDAFFLGQA